MHMAAAWTCAFSAWPVQHVLPRLAAARLAAFARATRPSIPDHRGNSEWQSYTPRTVNARQESGMLVIQAQSEPYTGAAVPGRAAIIDDAAFLVGPSPARGQRAAGLT